MLIYRSHREYECVYCWLSRKRATGEAGPLLYETELAMQTKEAASMGFNTSYYNLVVGARLKGVTVKIGHQS